MSTSVSLLRERTPAVFQLLKRVDEVRRDYAIREQLRRAKVIPSEQGEFVAAIDTVFSTGVVPSGKWAVHHAVLADKEARQVLEKILGVRPLDDIQWGSLLWEALRGAESSSFAEEPAWAKVWSILRSAPENVAKDFISANGAKLRVRCRTGDWRTSNLVLLPGTIVPDDPSTSHVLLDQVYHVNDSSYLDALDIRSEPSDRMLPWESALGSADQDISTWLAIGTVRCPRKRQEAGVGPPGFSR